MRYFFLLFLLVSSLFLTAGLFEVSQAQGQNQDNYSLALQGFVWNHSTLKALVVTADNESWWKPDFQNTALRAIGQWNDAIAAFASNYTDYSYLSYVRIQPSISTEPQPGFDIYVFWTESPLSNVTDELGSSQIFPSYQSAIINCTVKLATHTSHGDSLDQGDQQNVALHELGHSLGLGHSNFTGDLMNAYYNRGSAPEAVSTLDAYGVATLFAWEQNTTRFYPINNWLNEDSVILPSDITYRGLPVSTQNVLPQTLANNSIVQTLILMFEILIHPEIFAIALLFISVMIIIAMIPKGKRANADK